MSHIQDNWRAETRKKMKARALAFEKFRVETKLAIEQLTIEQLQDEIDEFAARPDSTIFRCGVTGPPTLADLQSHVLDLRWLSSDQRTDIE